MEKSLNLRSSSGPSTWILGKTHGKGEDNMAHHVINQSINWGSHRLIKTKAASMGPTWVCTRSSVYMLWLIARCFLGNPDSGILFFLLHCLFLGLFLQLGYLALMYLVWLLSLEGLLVCEGKLGKKGSRGEERCTGLGERAEGELLSRCNV